MFVVNTTLSGEVMNQKKQHYVSERTILGIFLILIGALLLLDRFDIIYIESIWQFWPLIFVLIGITKLVQAADRFEVGAGVWWLFLGAWFLVSLNHFWGLNFHDTWPALIIAFGVSILWKSYGSNTSFHCVKE